MYINAVGYYIPEKRITNDYFTELNGLASDWIYQRTGIMSRSRAAEKETINYMCSEAVNRALPQLPYKETDTDLIIFASYTPSDTIATTAHLIQRDFGMTKAKAFMLSSACSSAVNAIEIIKSFFETGRATKALLICADRNTSYSDDTDCKAGHLWGDAATAFFFSADQIRSSEIKLIDVTTQGLGHIGQGPNAVFLELQNNGLQMPYGKDVFMQACTYIAKNTKEIIEDNEYNISDLSYFIGHQANKRIISHVIKELDIPEEKSLTNITSYGNTGSASALLVFAENYDKFQKGDLICMSVFGGGYSAGSCLFTIP